MLLILYYSIWVIILGFCVYFRLNFRKFLLDVPPGNLTCRNQDLQKEFYNRKFKRKHRNRSKEIINQILQ